MARSKIPLLRSRDRALSYTVLADMPAGEPPMHPRERPGALEKPPPGDRRPEGGGAGGALNTLTVLLRSTKLRLHLVHALR